MYGSLYVVNLFKQKVVQQKNDLFATVMLHNIIFCHRLWPSAQHKSSPFTYVLRKDMSTTLSSLVDQNVPHLEKNVLNKISHKSNLNHTAWLKFCDGSFTIQ